MNHSMAEVHKLPDGEVNRPSSDLDLVKQEDPLCCSKGVGASNSLDEGQATIKNEALDISIDHITVKEELLDLREPPQDRFGQYGLEREEEKLKFEHLDFPGEDTPQLLNEMSGSYKKCSRLLDGFSTDESVISQEEGCIDTPSLSTPAAMFKPNTFLSAGSNIPRNSFSEETGQQILEKLISMEKRLQNLETLTNRFVKNDIVEMKQSITELKGASSHATVHPPANSMEELDTLLACENIVTTLVGMERVSLGDTLRCMLQRIMTRQLALTFSISGMGRARQAVKESFSQHKGFQFMLDAISFTRHRDADPCIITEVLGGIFRRAGDWGGDRKRKRQIDNMATVQSHMQRREKISNIVPGEPSCNQSSVVLLGLSGMQASNAVGQPCVELQNVTHDESHST